MYMYILRKQKLNLLLLAAFFHSILNPVILKYFHKFEEQNVLVTNYGSNT